MLTYRVILDDGSVCVFEAADWSHDIGTRTTRFYDDPVQLGGKLVFERDDVLAWQVFSHDEVGPVGRHELQHGYWAERDAEER